jgi:hypothetical protein
MQAGAQTHLILAGFLKLFKKKKKQKIKIHSSAVYTGNAKAMNLLSFSFYRPVAGWAIVRNETVSM